MESIVNFSHVPLQQKKKDVNSVTKEGWILRRITFPVLFFLLNVPEMPDIVGYRGEQPLESNTYRLHNLPTVVRLVLCNYINTFCEYSTTYLETKHIECVLYITVCLFIMLFVSDVKPHMIHINIALEKLKRQFPLKSACVDV